MTVDAKTDNSSQSNSKFFSSLKFLLIFGTIAALAAGFIMGLQVFEALAQFKILGIFIIVGSIVGAVLLLAMVKILNDLAYIKRKLVQNN
jgi:hypothetical protein